MNMQKAILFIFALTLGGNLGVVRVKRLWKKSIDGFLKMQRKYGVPKSYQLSIKGTILPSASNTGMFH
jgi:hypothetical protein